MRYKSTEVSHVEDVPIH